MGEAKRKKAVMKAKMIDQIQRWNFPASEAEVQAVAEINNLPKVLVKRLSKQKMAEGGMIATECHANARFMEVNDPAKELKQVAGYWLQQGNYVFHSVIQTKHGYICITPTLVDSPEVFEFIPDPDIEWREENGFNVAYRKGFKIDAGFRIDPVKTKSMLDTVMARLDAGMDPIEAARLPNDN